MIDVLPIFPCNEAKEPLVARGFKSARMNVKHSGWPLIGFPTGEASGIDVLDVDPRGRDWFDANFDGLPQTRAHSTQRGLHLLFKHAPGLRCSTSGIADGIDVRAEGGYAIWWPREGLPIEDFPICEWPEWLLKEAMEACGGVRPPKENLSRVNASMSGVVVRPGLREALFQLDPISWRNTDASKEGYDRWFQLMMAVKAAGISVDDWIEWCVGDPVYARDGREIARLWQGAPARHYGAPMAALKQAGINVTHTPEQKSKPTEVPLRARDWRSRFDGIRKWLRRHPTEQNLFNTSCFVAEIIDGRWTATIKALLLQDCAANGLTKLLGVEGCRKTIERGFAHIEEREKALASA
jgi:hypothetical protein